jgi:hypothetical protein
MTKDDLIAAMLVTTYEGVVAVSDIDENTRLEISELIKEMLPDIMNMDAAQIFAFVQGMASSPDFTKNIGNLKDLVKRHTEKLSRSSLYNDTKMIESVKAIDRKVGIVTTEKTALNNPLFAKGIEDAQDAGATIAFVYGDDFKNEDQARAFALASGLDKERAAKIEFINKNKNGKKLTMEELEQEIVGRLPDIAPENIGITVAPREIDGRTAKMKVLQVHEISMNSRSVLLASNTERVLYRMLKLMGDKSPEKSMSLDRIVQGLYYDASSKRYTYLPPIVAKDIGEEVETYRNAMLLLSSAA